jgi:hypothetical protein
MMPFTVALLASLSLGNLSDTTLAVRSGGRLEVSNFSGSVSVDTWSRDAVRVRVRCDGGMETEVTSESGGLHLESTERRNPPGRVEYRITAPTWMPIEVSGPMNDVEIDGSKASVNVETVNGDVTLRGGSGDIELTSVQGDVSVTGASGHLKLSAINQGVTVVRSSGQAEVETVNGDIMLDDVQLDELDASSVSGNMWFRGALKDQGRYQLESHAGDIQVVMADQPSARVTVSTYSGEVSSDYQIGLKNLNSKEDVTFTLGGGGARLGLESFSGRIQLLKASSVESMRKSISSSHPEKGKEPKNKNKDKSDNSDDQ